jgi:Ca2+-binding EF-hand superfamily protein
MQSQVSLFGDRSAFDVVQAAILIQPMVREYVKVLVNQVKKRCKKIEKYTKRGDTDIDYNFAGGADAKDEDEDAENAAENEGDPNVNGTTEVEMVSVPRSLHVWGGAGAHFRCWAMIGAGARGAGTEEAGAGGPSTLGIPDASDAPIITVAMKRSLAMQALSHDGPTNTAQLVVNLKESLMLTMPLEDFASEANAATARADMGVVPLQSASHCIDELVHFVGHVSAFAIEQSLQGEEKKERLPEVAEARQGDRRNFTYPENEQRAVAQRVFDELDADQSGSLDEEEFRALCERIGLELTPQHLAVTFCDCETDTDGDGDVNFEEFFAWFSKNGFEVDVGSMSTAKVMTEPVSPADAPEVEPELRMGSDADRTESACVGSGVGSDDVAVTVNPAQELEPEQHPQDDPEKETAREVFNELDKDDSGMLDQNEFQNLCNRVGLSLNKIQADVLFREVDKNGSGELDFEEFFEWYTTNGFKIVPTS